jgi:hypothetical protein
MTNEKEKLQQAVNIIKQTLDQAFKIGVAINVEQATAITQAFQYLIQILQNGAKPDSNDTTNS